MRSELQDFLVFENLGVEFSGDGEHDLLQVQKSAANTDWVARQIAAYAGVKAADVGYSGLKDRHAITQQWFSVPRWNSPDWQRFDADDIELLDVQRHTKKLRRGTHRSNRFRICLRGEFADIDALYERLTAIRDIGVPNYFGPQRFGRLANNLRLADSWARGARLPRQKRSIAISSVRSFLFNQFLSERVAAGNWNQFLPGDTANLDGSGSLFTVDTVDREIESRCDNFDIHPTGPLFGASDADLDDERYSHWLQALRDARVKSARRSLRVVPEDMTWQCTADVITLSFTLTRGAYATSLLRELLDAVDAHT